MISHRGQRWLPQLERLCLLPATFSRWSVTLARLTRTMSRSGKSRRFISFSRRDCNYGSPCRAYEAVCHTFEAAETKEAQQIRLLAWCISFPSLRLFFNCFEFTSRKRTRCASCKLAGSSTWKECILKIPLSCARTEDAWLYFIAPSQVCAKHCHASLIAQRIGFSAFPHNCARLTLQLLLCFRPALLPLTGFVLQGAPLEQRLELPIPGFCGSIWLSNDSGR